MVEITIDSYEDLVNIVGDFSTKVVFEVRDITASQKKLIEGVAKAVNASPLKYGEIRSLSSVYEILMDWWVNLPTVAKIVTLYEKLRQNRLKELKNALHKMQDSDRFAILLEQLPSIYIGAIVGDQLTDPEADSFNDNFADDVKLLESGFHRVRMALAEAISGIFGTEGDLVHCEAIIDKWYQDLNPNQRDPYKSNDDDAQAFLLRLSDKSKSFETRLLQLLPQDYGFGPVAEWSALKVDDYASKIRQAKQSIDEAKPDVPAPSIESKTWELEAGDSFEVELPEGVTEIIYTITGEDPKKSDKIIRVKEKLDLYKHLDNKPNVSIVMRSLDAHGNASEPVKVELINKSKKYEISIERDLFGQEKGTFKFPENDQGLLAVISSLLQHSLKRDLIDKTRSESIIDFVKKILSM